MNVEQIIQYCNNTWDSSIIAELVEYIKIPCKSPAYDSQWEQNGYLDAVANRFKAWALAHPLRGMSLDIIRFPERTPLLCIEIPGQSDTTVLLYGHMDKQPEMQGWDADLGPWKPVLKNDKLYGRGGADDGYAMFTSLTAIAALQAQDIPHARCVVIIEASEESGSTDLPFYIEHLATRIGQPDFVICLDSGCGNYEQLWSTTSLRGNAAIDMTVQVLTEGVHSGAASGAVPSSFRILRSLLSRIEDETTGEIKLPECHVTIPAERLKQAELATKVLNDEIYTCFPFVPDTVPVGKDPKETLLLKTWYPTLSVTGIEGLPNIANAGSVLLPFTTVRLSFRLPPTCNAPLATEAITNALTTNPPYGAKITYSWGRLSNGWNAPVLSDWLAKASDSASQAVFGKPTMYMGEGGTIPFMGMLGEKFPQAQFLIVGVLGPQSNAHGPNEFLHIPMAKKLTACVAYVLAEHFNHIKD
jgi:acetylornithine deacetylase/succinyl-diaminopimelate desuccinylase-like protein